MVGSSVAEELSLPFLDSSPPCNCLPDGILPRCGRLPTVIRVEFSCTCGNRCHRFLCEWHYAELLAGNFRCNRCKAFAGHGFSWKEA